MPRRKQSSHTWIYMIWGMNGFAILSILAFFAFYRMSLAAPAADAPTSMPRPGATQELPPTSYYLPTLTPNPYYTPPVFETVTPFVLVAGPRPNMIGYSFGGRPIEAYRFGAGEKEYLIVAGIHGGYEGNTIALANELITYINDNPGVIPTDTTLYIIRNMNPDGEARSDGVDGRVNNNGVDLNRNFPAKNWTPDWNRDGCWIYRPTTG